MIRHYLLIVVSFCLVSVGAFSQTYSNVSETITFDSSDDGQTHGMFDPSTEANPYSINQGYSLPTLWNGGVKPTYNNTFILGPSFPSIPSFGCSSIPGASTILDFLGLNCADFNFPGFSMGGGLIFEMTATMELDIDFVGFGEDSMRIIYPARITTERPNDFSYNAGEWVTLTTDSDLDQTATNPAPKLDTYYPSTGHIEGWLDLDMETDISLGFTMNIFGLNYNLSYPILSVSLEDFLENTIGMSDSRFPIYKVDSTRSFCWGSVNYFDPLTLPVSGWFPNLPGILQPLWFAYAECSFPWDQIPNYCQYGQFYDDDLPLEISTGPITGMLDLPNVSTAMTMGVDNMNAVGTDLYTNVDLSIPDLASLIIDKIPCGCAEPPAVPTTVCPPGPPAACFAVREAVVYALDHLTFDASFDLPGFDDDLEIEWALFTATISLNQLNRVEVDFVPSIYGKYSFPTPVDYVVVNSLGAPVSSGQGSEINYSVGDTVKFKYPCYYSELTVDRSYTIDGEVTSEIGDTYTLSTAMTAGGIAFQIPGFNLFPGYTFSESIPYPDVCWGETCVWGVCVSYPYPCISWYQLTVSFPSVTIPTISFNTCDDLYSLIPGVDVWDSTDPAPNPQLSGDCDNGTGAMIVYNEVIAEVDPSNFPLWYTNTWSFEGFVEEYGTSLVLKANTFSANAVVANVDCNGTANGGINVSLTNGSSGFTYEWTNGGAGVYASTQDLTNVPAGNYFLTITDVNQCETVTGGTITEPLPMILTSALIDVNCNGGSTGNIDLIVSGGLGTYSYNWTTVGGSGLIPADQDQTGLSQGTYTVVVSDPVAPGCSVTDDYVIDEPTVLSLTTSAVDANCAGNADGSMDATVSGGSVPYTYNWTTVGGSGIIAGALNQPNLTAGSYTLQIVDAKGCTISSSETINEPFALTVTSIPTDVLCYSENTGTISLTVTDGTGPYSYVWYDQTGAMTSNTSINAIDLYAGDHNVIVTDSRGCVESELTTVNEPAELLITSSTVQDVNCNGFLTGAITIVTAGGMSPYNYFDWDNDGTGDNDDTQNLTGLGAGTYAVVLEDGNGCQITETYTIDEPLLPLSADSIVTDVKCFADATGEIDATITGGTQPYTYSWSTVTGSGLVASAEDQTGLTAGTYTLNLTDDKACVLTPAMVVIVNEPTALILDTTHVDVLCFGGNNGSIDLTITGGTTPYTHEWSNSASTVLTPTTEDLIDLTADTYSVLVTDSNQCTATLSVVIDQPLAPIALTDVVVDVDCFGSATGSIDLTPTGGTITYTYDWDNDGVGDNDDTQDLTGLTAGQYVVILTDVNGCQESLTATVNQPTIGITPTVVVSPVLCFGEGTGSIDLEVIGGTAPYRYDWDIDGTGDYDDTQDVEGLVSGFYSVTIIDTNGCTQTSGGFIDQPAQALTITATVTEPSCFGYTDGSIDLAIVGGTTPYFVEWGDQNEFLLNNPSELLSGLGKGEYFFRITDENGCVYEQFVNVDQPDTLEVDFTVLDVACYGGSDGEITLSPNGGTAPYNYTWSNGSLNQNQTGLISGDYSYVLLDDNGCVFEQSIFVDQSPDINIYQEVSPLSCIDQLDAGILIQTAGGMQPYTWQWSNGETTEHIEDLGAGTYQVVITDDFGCIKTYDFLVTASDIECVHVVNTFTPNGDNYNDTWIIENLYLYPNAEVRVFNRWGNLLLESVGEYTPWDGIYKGTPLPSEVYYYVIVLNNGVDNQYTGTITIVR